ncbi:MAG: 16S rRNA (uracil(1498)-N(3))-methyltransferase [Clostridia bacterium]|nr:16S rRNA (uracil(1498)-N(3))-methyltransferase [Clostridia bacterium]
MAWFFSDIVTTPVHTISGEDAQHIIKSLRMKIGEELSICDGSKIQYDCVIENIGSGTVDIKILDSYPCKNEPHTKVTLYQALAKGDKMDFIIQKAVELGVSEIVPILTARCVSRPDEKSMKKKTERWNKIALQAAMQSRRGIIPTVKPMMKLTAAAKQAGSTAVVCYELGGKPLGELVESRKSELSLFIGSEGGFERSEVEEILNLGGSAATLGNRILRAETAPLAALSVIMYLTGNLGNENTEVRTDNGEEIKGGNWFNSECVMRNA